MIDFKNAAYVKLSAVNNDEYASIVNPILAPNEEIIQTFSGMRDGVVFTTKRIIAINIQGLTGKKKDITSLPYSRIQTFSIETAGTFDLDCELDLWFSGLGSVRFEFVRGANITTICKMISDRVL